MRFCKTTPCIKKSANIFKHMTLRTFGPSETGKRPSALQFWASRGPKMQDMRGRAGALPALQGEAAATGVHHGGDAGVGIGDRRLQPFEVGAALGLAGGEQALAGRAVEAARRAAGEDGGEP